MPQLKCNQNCPKTNLKKAYDIVVCICQQLVVCFWQFWCVVTHNFSWYQNENVRKSLIIFTKVWNYDVMLVSRFSIDSFPFHVFFPFFLGRSYIKKTSPRDDENVRLDSKHKNSLLRLLLFWYAQTHDGWRCQGSISPPFYEHPLNQ